MENGSKLEALALGWLRWIGKYQWKTVASASDRREIVVFELLQACPQFCEVQIRLSMGSEFVNMREQQISMVISIFVCLLENGIKFE